MQNDESFPNGYLGVTETPSIRSRALSRAESLNIYVDENEDKKLKSISAKERWEPKLDPITVQSLFLRYEPRKDVKVRLPSVCISTVHTVLTVVRKYHRVLSL